MEVARLVQKNNIQEAVLKRKAEEVSELRNDTTVCSGYAIDKFE